MSNLPGRLAAVAALGLAGALVTGPAAHAVTDQACSEYGQGCDSSNGTKMDDDDQGDDSSTGIGGTRGGTGDSSRDLGAAPDSLPLTGGEAVLLALTGGGALAAGTALVVASRRRSA